MGAEYICSASGTVPFWERGPFWSVRNLCKRVPRTLAASLGLSNELDVPKGMELPESTNVGCRAGEEQEAALQPENRERAMLKAERAPRWNRGARTCIFVK